MYKIKNNLRNIYFPIFMLLSLLSQELNANNIIEELLYLGSDSKYQHSNLELVNSTFDYIDKVRVDGSYKEDFDKSRQISNSIRVYPKDFDAYDLEKKQFQTKKEYVNQLMDKENLLLQEKNYQLIVDAKFQKKMMDFVDKNIALYQNQLSIKKRLMDGKFYVESIFFMSNEIKLLKLKSLKQKQLYMSTLKTIRFILKEKYGLEEIKSSINAYRLNSSSEIISKINNSRLREIRESNIDTKLYEKKAQILQKNLRLEQMKEKFNFDFVELGYTTKQFQGDSINIGFGLDLPLKKNNQIKVMEERLALVELEEKSRIEDEEYLRDAKLIINKIKTFYAYEQGVEEVLIDDKFYNLYSKKEDADPRFILEIQERNLDLEEELLSIQEKLHREYIELLGLTHGLNDSELQPYIKREEF